MTKKNKIIIAIVAVFFVIAIGATIFFSRDKKKEVDLFKVEEQNPITFSGSAEASENQEILADSTKGEIVDYYVKDGEEVVVGQKLFIYENETVKDTVDELTLEYNNTYSSYKDANSEVSKAKGELSSANKKIKELTSKIDSLSGAIDPNNPESAGGNTTGLQRELEEAMAKAQGAEATIAQGEQSAKQLKTQYESMGQKIDSTKKKLNHVEKASIAGIVKLDKNAANSAVSMSGGSPVVSITSKDIVIKGKVSEYDYGKLQVEGRVNIEVANSGEEMEGTITLIDTMPIESGAQAVAGQQGGGSSIANYSFDVKPDKPIHYGFSVNIKLPQDDIFIPLEAVEKSSGKFYIYRVEDGKAVKDEIKVELEDDVYKLVSGLELGEEIIANVEGIQDGMEVNANVSADASEQPTDEVNSTETPSTNNITETSVEETSSVN